MIADYVFRSGDLLYVLIFVLVVLAIVYLLRRM